MGSFGLIEDIDIYLVIYFISPWWANFKVPAGNSKNEYENKEKTVSQFWKLGKINVASLISSLWVELWNFVQLTEPYSFGTLCN